MKAALCTLGSARTTGSAAGTASGPLLFQISVAHGTPNCVGDPSRLVRLAPKVSDATSAPSPTTAPPMVDHTGTLVRPRPRSRAMRTPTVTVAGSPARALVLASTEERFTVP